MSKPETYMGWKVDFTVPKGEPSLAHPSSLAWRIYKNPVALGVGGVAAVLLEFADARIRSGVWDHSIFKSDPIGRSKRTGTAAMVGVYGPASAARRVIAGVNNMHSRVEGTTPDGTPYKALEPELLNWVAATASYGFLMGYDKFVTPLSAAEKAEYFRAGSEGPNLYGVDEPVRSLEHFDEMMMRLVPRFEAHPINTEFLDIMMTGQAAPEAPKWLQRALVRASVSILPPIVRQKLELGREYDLSWWEALAIKAFGKLAEKIPAKNSPPAQAAIRLGLPYDFAWKSEKQKQKILAQAQFDEHAEAYSTPGE